MSNIIIVDIKPAGIELFADSESFMDELKENAINDIYGGRNIETNYLLTTSPYCPTPTSTPIC